MKVISKQEAFSPIVGEVSIPIDKSVHDFKFTRRWFQIRNQTTWGTFLKPRFSGVNFNWPVKMIQIGVFEGADLIWCLQNILTHPDSRVIAIDPWAPTTKLDKEYMSQVEARARYNLLAPPYYEKVKIVKGFSQQVLADMAIDPKYRESYDLIVIDGDHNAQPVYEDAVLSFELAKKNGFLVFDDVRNRVDKKDHVQDGIRMFLETHGDRVKYEWSHRYVDCYSKI